MIMDGTRLHPALRLALVVLVTGSVSGAIACSSKPRTPPPPHPLSQYDFRNTTLGVVTIAPPSPELLTGTSLRVDADQPRESLLRIGSDLAREAAARGTRVRLDSAAANVDVSGRMGARALEHSARQLRSNPVEDSSTADFELELRVGTYGIIASSWSAGAHFNIDANMVLLEGDSGRRIWGTRVQATRPVQSSIFSDSESVTNVVTATALMQMSTAEIELALESLADFAADAMVEELARALVRARR
jgi:hypothetical protein